MLIAENKYLRQWFLKSEDNDLKSLKFKGLFEHGDGLRWNRRAYSYGLLTIGN